MRYNVATKITGHNFDVVMRGGRANLGNPGAVVFDACAH